MASWNSSSLRALRGEDPLTTDCSSSWCSVARVCSASERILFFSTSCSNFRLRTWAHHTQTHTDKSKHANHSQKQKPSWILSSALDNHEQKMGKRSPGYQNFIQSLIKNRGQMCMTMRQALMAAGLQVNSMLTDWSPPPLFCPLIIRPMARETEMELRGLSHVYL